MRRLFRYLGTALLIVLVWMLLPLDGLTNNLRGTDPDIRRHESSSKTAVVFFTSVMSSGETHSAPLRDLWSERGDVIIVEYNATRFDGAMTAYTTYSKLVEWGYERAILIGAYMGGLVATDVIDYDRAGQKHLEYAVMLQDVPQGKDDLNESGLFEFATKAWYPGPITNWILTDLFWYYAFDPPPPYLQGEGVDQAQLSAHNQASSNYPLSGWTGELRYIAGHREFERNQYVGIPLVVMESQYDSVTKRTADKWRAVFGGGTVVEVRNASQVDFVSHPQEWRTGFEKGFAALKGW